MGIEGGGIASTPARDGRLGEATRGPGVRGRVVDFVFVELVEGGDGGCLRARRWMTMVSVIITVIFGGCLIQRCCGCNIQWRGIIFGRLLIVFGAVFTIVFSCLAWEIISGGTLGV